MNSAARPCLVRAAGVVDGGHVQATPGAILLEGNRILAVGTPTEVGDVDDARSINVPDAVVVPGLVNAHTHLDLTNLGPVPYHGDFAWWLDGVRRRRATGDGAVAASVRLGVRLARTGGTAFVGDIAGSGSMVPAKTLRDEGLRGVSFIEVFGIGARQTQTIDTMRRLMRDLPADDAGVRVGLQPHAPYSCGPEVYEAAAMMGRPLATHLAESLYEIEYTMTGRGPLVEMLKRFGAWDKTMTVPPRCHPVDLVLDAVGVASLLAVHLNYIDDAHVERLARNASSIHVVYCPRASVYFDHPANGKPPHRYRELIEAGVNVALGTDSMLCLDTGNRISVLDEMRLLYRRDGMDPRRLLAMATTAGADALGIDPDLLTLAPGPTAGLIGIRVDPASTTSPLVQALERDEAPSWVVGP